MLSVEEARDRILSYFEVLPVEATPLIDSLGQVLAENLVASFDIPPLANSAMDGYAVLASDTTGASTENPVELPVTGVVAAGQLPDHPLEPRTAIRIMTGAPIPDQANAVVPFEDTDELERRGDGGATPGTIGIRLQAEPYDNMRGAGEDVESGTTVFDSGQILRAGEIGVIASLGHATVQAVRRPVIAIVSTGDELLEPGEDHQPGKIYNSNAFSIAAMVTRYGGVPKIMGIARDTVESLESALEKALDADLVVTSAGVSKGDYDVVKDVLSAKGEIALWSVRMRPAKPLAFGVLDRKDGTKVPHLGLPGNPVSAMVAFEQFGRPAIRLMMGKPQVEKPSVEAIMDDPIQNHDGRRVYARVHVYRDDSGVYRAKSTGNQSSGVLSSMAQANGLAICPDDIGMINAGEIAKVEMLDWPDDIF
jgi:molybdopterin molybdotransferase